MDLISRYRDAFETVAGYCRAVRYGPTVAVSGTAATGNDGNALHPHDTYAQTKLAFERALAAARGLGANSEHSIHARFFLAPQSESREAVRTHHEIFHGVDPANTTLYVAGFIPPGVLVEVELDAWVPDCPSPESCNSKIGDGRASRERGSLIGKHISHRSMFVSQPRSRS